MSDEKVGSGSPAAMLPRTGTRRIWGPEAPRQPVRQLDSAGHARLPAEVALTVQDLEVVVDHRSGADLAARLDVPDGRWVVVVVQEVADELQYSLLPCRNAALYHVSPSSVHARCLT